jgi:hypothetical protein
MCACVCVFACLYVCVSVCMLVRGAGWLAVGLTDGGGAGMGATQRSRHRRWIAFTGMCATHCALTSRAT